MTLWSWCPALVSHVPWTWLLLLAVAGLGVWAAVRSFRRKREAHARVRSIRTALESHPLTLLLCLRAANRDAPLVAQCILQALRTAASPLRLTFAVVQDETTEDVYQYFSNIIRGSVMFDDLDVLSKVRTVSVMRSSYMHAASTWVSMHDGETLVVCADSRNEWLQDWDTQIAEAMATQPATAVLSAPESGQFCAIVRAPGNGTRWPTVVGRQFAFAPTCSTAAIAVHHNLLAFRGDHFAHLRPLVGVHVPLHAVDCVLSSWLLSNGACVLRTLPGAVFRRPSSGQEECDGSYFNVSRWDGRMRLSAAFLAHAGIVVADADVESAAISSASPSVPALFTLSARTQLGLTAAAAYTNEADIKYGSQRAMRQQYEVFRASVVRI